MALLKAGWFQTTWFPSRWWQEDWWLEYGSAAPPPPTLLQQGVRQRVRKRKREDMELFENALALITIIRRNREE